MPEPTIRLSAGGLRLPAQKAEGAQIECSGDEVDLSRYGRVRSVVSSDKPVASGLSECLSGDGSLKNREWLTTDQAADYLGLSVGALRNMTSNGQVPYHKLGRRNRYLVVELRQLLLSQKRGSSHGN